VGWRSCLFFSIGFLQTIFSIEKNKVLHCADAKTMTEKMGATTHDAPPSSAGHSRAVRWADAAIKTDDIL